MAINLLVIYALLAAVMDGLLKRSAYIAMDQDISLTVYMHSQKIFCGLEY